MQKIKKKPTGRAGKRLLEKKKGSPIECNLQVVNRVLVAFSVLDRK